MTQGDVTGTIGVVIGTGATLWASQMAAGVLFAEKTRYAAQAIDEQAVKTLGGGALVGITAGVLGIIFSNSPNGLLKLIGIGLLVGLLAIAVLGGAGLAQIAGRRIARLDSNLSPLGALGRGAGLLIGAAFLPVVGWFLLFPLMLLASVGAGVKALRHKTVVDAVPLPAQAVTSVSNSVNS